MSRVADVRKVLDLSKLSGRLLLRGLLPYYVMTLLQDGPKYGNQIASRIGQETRGKWKPSPGTLYPLLRRLVRAGVVEEVQGRPADRRPTRLYRLTPAGEEVLADLRRQIRPMLEETIHLLRTHLDRFPE